MPVIQRPRPRDPALFAANLPIPDWLKPKAAGFLEFLAGPAGIETVSGPVDPDVSMMGPAAPLVALGGGKAIPAIRAHGATLLQRAREKNYPNEFIRILEAAQKKYPRLFGHMDDIRYEDIPARPDHGLIRISGDAGEASTPKTSVVRVAPGNPPENMVSTVGHELAHVQQRLQHPGGRLTRLHGVTTVDDAGLRALDKENALYELPSMRLVRSSRTEALPQGLPPDSSAPLDAFGSGTQKWAFIPQGTRGGGRSGPSFSTLYNRETERVRRSLPTPQEQKDLNLLQEIYPEETRDSLFQKYVQDLYTDNLWEQRARNIQSGFADKIAYSPTRRNRIRHAIFDNPPLSTRSRLMPSH